jgi:hypothetical protein
MNVCLVGGPMAGQILAVAPSQRQVWIASITRRELDDLRALNPDAPVPVHDGYYAPRPGTGDWNAGEWYWTPTP